MIHQLFKATKYLKTFSVYSLEFILVDNKNPAVFSRVDGSPVIISASLLQTIASVACRRGEVD
jgi:hypothetical protein